MDKETQSLIRQVLANQVIIYKRLEQIEKSIKGGLRSASIETYVIELKQKADEALEFIE